MAKTKPEATPVSISAHVPEGMPALDLGGRPVSFFEFWPSWLMYLPVAIQCLFLGLRHRSMSLPLIANPAVPLSGMAGVPKSTILQIAGQTANRSILPWTTITTPTTRSQGEYLSEPSGESASSEPQREREGAWKGPGAGREGSVFLEQTLAAMKKSSLDFPIVGKPDIGCRGAGVKLLRDSGSLDSYLKQFPPGAAIFLQKLSDFEPEAGVFYVRDPKTEKGQITSLTLKYTPYVVGDGVRTLAELVAADPRARGLTRLYEERNVRHWREVIPEGRPHRLVFSASHCRGAVFRDGSHLVTRELTEALDRIFDDIPGFYYGRLDLKFRNVDSLRAGRDLQIVEINGASSESIHIWDRKAGFFDAMKTLLQQYRTLFTLGLENKRRGCKPPGLWPLYRAWRHELQLVKRYPVND